MKRKKNKRIDKNSKPLRFKQIFKSLSVLLGMVAIIYSGLLVKDFDMPTVLPVTDIQVKGELAFIDKEEIKALVKNSISGGYFTVDLKNIQALVLQKPWVNNVSLRREWPASVTIYVEEKRPVAYWNDDAYLSDAGVVFKPDYIDTTLNLPNLNGPSGQQEKVWKFMNTLYKEIAMLNYEVVRLELDDRRSWQLVMAVNVGIENVGIEKKKIEIKLGRFDTKKRLQRFVSILPALIAKHEMNQNSFATGEIKAIDMRYPNGFAVQFAVDTSEA